MILELRQLRLDERDDDDDSDSTELIERSRGQSVSVKRCLRFVRCMKYEVTVNNTFVNVVVGQTL